MKTLKNEETIGVFKIPLQKDFVLDGGSKDELLDEGFYKVAHLVRLVVFIPGKVVKVKEMNEDLLFSFGRMVAELDIGLQVCFYLNKLIIFIGKTFSDILL